MLLYWPLVVLVAAHAPAAAKLEEHTQLVVRSNTHGPVAVPSRGGCSGGEGGEGGPGEAALVSSEVELVCRGAEWLRHYAELNQVAP